MHGYAPFANPRWHQKLTPLPPGSYRFLYSLPSSPYASDVPLGAKQLLTLIRVLPTTGCWEFMGSRDAYGYGRMYTGNKELKAHRYFYELCESPVPPGTYLQHRLPPEKCIGHACCNPAHLIVSNSPKAVPSKEIKTCPKGHLMTPENTVVEQRKGHPKARCRKCRQESWRKNSARRSAMGKHT